MRHVLPLICAAALVSPTVVFGAPPPPAAAFRADASGFPLPVDAARRLGSPAFRAPDSVGQPVLSPDGKVITEFDHESHQWFVGRDTATGRVLWRSSPDRQRKLSGPVAEPGRVRLLERIGTRTVRFVWFDQATGQEREPGERFDLGTLHADGARDRTIFADLSGRWVLVHDHRWVNTIGIEETETEVFVHDRLGERPPLALGQASAAVAPDGGHAVVTPVAGPVRLVDLVTGLTVRELADAGAAPFGPFNPVVSADRKRLAAWVSTATRRSLKVWDLATGTPVEVAAYPRADARQYDRPDPFGGPVGFSADGARLTFRSPAGGWSGHDVATGKSVAATVPVPRRSGDLVTPDGKTVFVPARFRTALVPRDAATNAPTAAAPDPVGDVTALHFAPDGRLQALADGRVFVYDPATGKEVARGGSLPVLNATQFSADGSKVAGFVGQDDMVVRVCDARTGKEVAATGKVAGRPSGFALSPDGARVITVTNTGQSGCHGTVREWDAGTGKPLAEWADTTDDFPGRLATVSPDGKTLAYKDANYLSRATGRFSEYVDTLARLTVWDLTTAKGQPRKFTARGAYPEALAFSPDSRRLFTVNRAGLNEWDVPSGTLKRAAEIPGNPHVTLLAVSLDGTLAAAAETDAVIRLFDLSTGREVRRLAGHEGRIAALAISPDGKWLASASPEAPIFVWPLKK